MTYKELILDILENYGEYLDKPVRIFNPHTDKFYDVDITLVLSASFPTINHSVRLTPKIPFIILDEEINYKI